MEKKSNKLVDEADLFLIDSGTLAAISLTVKKKKENYSVSMEKFSKLRNDAKIQAENCMKEIADLDRIIKDCTDARRNIQIKMGIIRKISSEYKKKSSELGRNDLSKIKKASALHEEAYSSISIKMQEALNIYSDTIVSAQYVRTKLRNEAASLKRSFGISSLGLSLLGTKGID